jgi:twitching motility protein PilT
VETTPFTGAPQGDDSRPGGSDPAAEFGFFTPAEAPTASAESAAATEEAPVASQTLEPVEDQHGAQSDAHSDPPSDVQPDVQPDADPFGGDPLGMSAAADAPDWGQPTEAPTSQPEALLAPEEPASELPSGLPMSLTIAAEEAATVDVDAEPEPQGFDYQAFHEQQPAEQSPAEPTAADGAATDDYSPFGDLTGDQAPEVGLELADAAADEPSYTRLTTEPTLGGEDIVLVELLLMMLERGASDLHITAGARPAIRVNGELTQIDEYPVLTPPVIQRVMYAAITQRQREIFEEELELDFAYSVPGRARFRVNMYRQRDSVGAAFRIIPFEIKKLEDLGVPNAVANFAALPRGFVLVTGPTGSGKSTTLASVLDLANRNRKDHIMTCEDPIEFLHRHQQCLVNQREVGEDTKSFQNALKHVLRQDPDIILVGEMRDLETIGVALTAAETGHLVYATLHTQDAAQTIDRVIDVFPPHQQQQVRAQLAQAIQGVVCQTLARTTDGKGRVVACEVMVATPAIRNLIREGKTHQIYSAMQAGAKYGMQTMDQHLADLVNKGRITYDTGLEKCHHIEDFNRLTGRG